ncbi:hypothetical protein ACOSQ3_004656 [Xanthoceras sorbifolium]
MLHVLKPTLVMAVVQVASAAVNVFIKLATNHGMSSEILVAYRFIFATGFMTPLALFLESILQCYQLLYSVYIC